MTMPQPERRKILIIDDEPDVVRYLETLLQDNGYDAVSARDGNEGLEKLRTEKPDLVCLDLAMPEKSGIRFYREVRQDADFDSVKVVVVTAVTGYGGDADAVRRFLGTRRKVPPPDGFVAKPIERESFLEMIAKLLSAER
jgi:CheY-like chemotaxis protein